MTDHYSLNLFSSTPSYRKYKNKPLIINHKRKEERIQHFFPNKQKSIFQSSFIFLLALRFYGANLTNKRIYTRIVFGVLAAFLHHHLVIYTIETATISTIQYKTPKLLWWQKFVSFLLFLFEMFFLSRKTTTPSPLSHSVYSPS